MYPPSPSYGHFATLRNGKSHARPQDGQTDRYVPLVPGGRYSDEQIDAAIDAITQPGAFGDAERMVARAAPQLQRVLAAALNEGGWFGESHEAGVLKAATTPGDEERLVAVRTLLAEEARMGMMVGVSVGWAMAEQLARADTDTETEED